MKRWLILASAAVALASCQQALGLDDLSYDQPPENLETLEQDAGSGGAAGATSATDAGAPACEHCYPEVWQSQKLVPASEPGASYFVYDRASGMLAEHFPSPSGYTVNKEFGWVPNQPRVFQLQQEPPILVGYDAVSGLVEHLTVTEDGPKQQRRAGSPGWTHLVGLGADRLLAYNAATGHVRLGAATLDGDAAAPLLGEWEPGYTTITRHPLDGAEGEATAVFLYEQATGDAKLMQVQSDGYAVEVLAEGQLAPGYSGALAFRVAGETRLLLYEPEHGRVVVGNLDYTDGLRFEILEQAPWREGLTDFSAIEIAGAPYAILFSSMTGVASLRRLYPLEKDVFPVD